MGQQKARGEPMQGSPLLFDVKFASSTSGMAIVCKENWSGAENDGGDGQGALEHDFRT